MNLKQLLQDLSYKTDKNISRHAKGLLLALSPNDGGLEWELINTQEKENSEKRAKNTAIACYEGIN